MEERAEYFGQLSRRIWEFAEAGYKEKQGSDLLKTELRAAGHEYRSRIPVSQKPPLNYRDKS